MDVLSSSEAFWWGSLGGLIALLVTQIMPAATALVKSTNMVEITPTRVVAATVLVLGFAAAGGAAALVIGDAEKVKDAMVYGMAWEAILGGAIKTGRAALP